MLKFFPASLFGGTKTKTAILSFKHPTKSRFLIGKITPKAALKMYLHFADFCCLQ
jgi:hypothetical protein